MTAREPRERIEVPSWEEVLRSSQRTTAALTRLVEREAVTGAHDTLVIDLSLPDCDGMDQMSEADFSRVTEVTLCGDATSLSPLFSALAMGLLHSVSTPALTTLAVACLEADGEPREKDHEAVSFLGMLFFLLDKLAACHHLRSFSLTIEDETMRIQDDDAVKFTDLLSKTTADKFYLDPQLASILKGLLQKQQWQWQTQSSSCVVHCQEVVFLNAFTRQTPKTATLLREVGEDLSELRGRNASYATHQNAEAIVQQVDRLHQLVHQLLGTSEKESRMGIQQSRKRRRIDDEKESVDTLRTVFRESKTMETAITKLRSLLN